MQCYNVSDVLELLKNEALNPHRILRAWSAYDRGLEDAEITDVIVYL
jgi:hypothetical protein